MAQLEFMDCPTCGKRMVTTAPLCRHCGQAPDDSAQLNRRSARQSAPMPDESPDERLADNDANNESQAHLALETGGYENDDDDFDYEEFLEREQLRRGVVPRTRVKPWIWITAWLLIIATLLPFVVILFSR